jgi:hypothetical protein
MTSKRADSIPYRNHSPRGWWIASYLERFEYYNEDRRRLGRRCTAWENTVLIKARTRDHAWRKATALGRLSEGSEAWDETGRKGQWRYEGLTSLLPVYEDLEDGAEILWVEHSRCTVRRIKAMAKSKLELEAFDDRNLRDAPIRSEGRSNNQMQRTMPAMAKRRGPRR